MNLIERLVDQIHEETHRCRAFKRNPWDSPMYRRINRQLLIQQEDSNTKIRRLKAVLVVLLMVAMPIVLWMWLYIITKIIERILS